MSCEYCQSEKGMFFKLVPYSIWGKEVNDYKNFALFIDRGYLRFADAEDKNCLDHGEKIKINYCPMCGTEIE